MKLQTTQISEFVDELAKRADKHDIKWFMQKYGITYEEYSLLSYAAMPAMSYRAEAGKYKNRLATFTREISIALEAGRRLNEHVQSEGMNEVFDMIYEALYRARRPFETDSY